MISNQTISIIQSAVRASGASSTGDKRRIAEAVLAELGINPAESHCQSTDYVIPFKEAARRFGCTTRTLTGMVRRGQISAVRKQLKGRRLRSVGIAASELEACIRRMSSTGEEGAA